LTVEGELPGGRYVRHSGTLCDTGTLAFSRPLSPHHAGAVTRQSMRRRTRARAAAVRLTPYACGVRRNGHTLTMAGRSCIMFGGMTEVSTNLCALAAQRGGGQELAAPQLLIPAHHIAEPHASDSVLCRGERFTDTQRGCCTGLIRRTTTRLTSRTRLT